MSPATIRFPYLAPRCTLLCTLLAALMPTAVAQTTAQPVPFLVVQLAQLPEFSRGGDAVRIYGTVDTGAMVSTTDKAESRWQMQSGGAHTSKLGFYASEDLGSGVKAEIKLEAGFNADTGVQQANALFNRESWIGLRSADWGTLRLGNQINAMLPLYIDPFVLVSTNSVYTWVGGGAVQGPRGVGANTDLGPGAGTIPVRVPKSITYATPRFKGLSAQGILAANPQGAGEPKLGVRGGTLGWNAGPVYLAASLTQSWSAPVVVAGNLPARTVRTDMPALGAIFDNGSLVLSTSYVRIKPRLPAGGEAAVSSLGVIVPRGQWIYRASAVHRDTEGARNGAGQRVESSALGLMLGVDCYLSRRTALYTRVGSVRNFGASTIILNGVALPFQPGSSAPQTGIETRTASLGLFHHF